MAQFVTIDKAGLTTFAGELLTKVATNLDGKFVDTLDETVTNEQIPSALAVFNALKAIEPTMDSKTVVGPIEDVEDPSATTIYLQKDDEEDTTWTMYIYADEQWVGIGSTDIDLTNYWSKSEVAELRNQVLDETGAEKVKEIVGYNTLLKNDEETKQMLVEYLSDIFVKAEDVTTMSEEDIKGSVAGA